MSVIEFTVPGVPVAQPRQRHRIVHAPGGHSFVSNYTPKGDKVNAFKAATVLAASMAYKGPPLPCPLAVELTFVFPRPKNIVWKSKPMPRIPHAKKPDVDNLAKSFFDCLNRVLWHDDAQVVDCKIKKLIAAGDEQPAVYVRIVELRDQP